MPTTYQTSRFKNPAGAASLKSCMPVSGRLSANLLDIAQR